MFYWISRFISALFLKSFFTIKIEGGDSLPRNTNFILASNHLSNLDPVILGVFCPQKLYFLAKEELFASKLSHFFFKSLGVIALKRGKADISAIKTAIEIIKHGKSVCIFPQGRRGVSLDQVMGGVGFLCKKTKAPLVLAKIVGTDKVLPKGAKYFKRYPMKVIFRRAKDIDISQDYKAVARRIIENIESF